MPQQRGLSVTETFLRHGGAQAPRPLRRLGFTRTRRVSFAHRPLLFQRSCVSAGAGLAPRRGRVFQVVDMLALHLPPEKLCPLLVSVALSFQCS